MSYYCRSFYKPSHILYCRSCFYLNGFPLVSVHLHAFLFLFDIFLSLFISPVSLSISPHTLSTSDRVPTSMPLFQSQFTYITFYYCWMSVSLFLSQVSQTLLSINCYTLFNSYLSLNLNSSVSLSISVGYLSFSIYLSQISQTPLSV